MTAGLLLCLVMTQIQPALAQVEQGQESAGGTQSAPAVVVSHHSSGKQLPVPANSARGIMRGPASHGLPVASPATRSSTRSATAIDFISDAADWLLTQQQMSGGFPWTAGTTSVFTNTQAPTAYGLIQAFRRTGNSDYIDAATNAGDFLLANPENFPSTSIKRFTAADTLFLVELTRATGDSQYRDLVVNDFWNRLEAGNYGPDNNWDAADFVAAEFVRRSSIPELVAWDLSWGVVAAHIEGRTAIAQAFLDGIVESLESVPDTGASNDLVGLAGAVWAAARTGLELDPTSGKWAADDSVMDLANTLLTFQQASGGILFNSSSDPQDATLQDTQVTAFTLLALDLLDRDGFSAQIASAGQYLIDQQQVSGQILSYPTAGVGDQGGVEVHGESMVAWASSQMRPGLIESVTATGAAPTATDNDYTRINNAVQMALDDDVIQLSGTFDWTEPNAFNSWVNGSDGVADTGDDYAILYPAGRNSITLTAANPGDAVILGPGDLAVQNLEGFVVVASAENRNLEFSNLRIEGFDLSIGMFFVPGQGVNLYDGTRIVNNHIIMPTDIAGNTAAAERLQNIGIHFAFGDNQLIADNIIDIPGDGTSTASTTSADVAMQSNTSSGAYEGLIIENNEVRILNAPSANPQNVVGIWENSNASDRNIIIRNNRFVNLDPNNDPLNNSQQGFRITSQRNTSTGNGTLMTGNLAQGANIGYAWLSFESFGADFSSRDPLDFVANTAIDNATGIRLDSNGSASFKCNIISGNATDGIANINQDQGIMSDATVNWWGCNDGPGTGSCDQISGNGVDGDNWLLFELAANPDSISVGDSSSLTASLLNTVNGDDSPTLADCTVPDGQDVDFAGGVAFGNVAPAMDTLEDGLAGSTFTATNAGVANDITATMNAGQTANTTILIDSPIGGSLLFVDDDFAGEEFGASVTFAHPALPAPGTTPANIGVNAFATVEEAQAVADIDADILIAEGSYGPAAGDPNTTLSITVEGLSLLGPNTQTAGVSTTRVPEAEFKFSNLSPDAANITIDGLAFVAPSPAARSVLMGGNFDGLTVVNNTFTGGRNAVFINKGGNHNIANNLITDLDTGNTAIVFGGLGVDRGSNSSVTNNVIRRVRNAISVTHNDMTISNNDIGGYSRGAINLRGGAHTIADNVIVGGDPVNPGDSIFGITLIPNSALEVTGNVLTGNDISNTDVAIFVLDGAQPDASGVPNSASNNLLGGNVVGLQNADADAFDATCNWWGDTSGPAGAGNGSGSEVTGNVLFQPWNTSTTGPCDGALELSFMPTDVNFGGVLDGTTDTSTVTIENTGDAPLTISTAALMNDTANVFSIINNTCSSLAVAANCQIELRFAPQSVQTFNASLEISSDAGTDTVPISGEGLATAALAINPTSFNFGGVVVGDTATTSFTLSNSGDPVSSLTLSTIAITGADFSVTGGTCTTTTPLDGGETCTVIVQFVPTAVEPVPGGSLEVGSDAGNVTATLAGEGLATAALAIDPTSFDFGDVVQGETDTATFTLSNSGDPVSSLTLSSIVVSGAEFSVMTGGTCAVTSTLDGDDDCTVIVEFAPNSVDTFTGNLEVASNAGNVSATLDGEGLAAANLQITPTDENFGSVLITESATSSFSLSNTGDPATTITLDAPALAAGTDTEFSISAGGNCAAGTELIGGGAACTVEVTFDPTSVAAAFTGTLEVGSDVNNVSAALSGASELPDWEDGFANTDPASGGFEQDWSFLGFDAMFNPLVPTTAAVTNDYLQIRDPAAIFAVGYVERTFNDNRTSALVNADGLGSGTDSGDSLDNQIDQGVIARFDPATTSGYAAYMRMELTAQELVLIKFDASNLDPALVDMREVVATSDDDDWNMGRMFITELDLVDQADGSVLVVARALDADSGAVLSRLEFNDPAGDAFATGFSGVVAIANATGLNGSFDTTAAVSAFASADLAPDSIDFGAVATGATDQQTVTLTNNGNDALVISDIAISGAAEADYTLQSDNCTTASPLAAGVSCTFDVGFTADATGQRTAEVLIDSSASTSQDIVLLDAAVFASDLTLTPQTQDFGAVLAGASSSPITFTVSNAGDAVTSLALNSIATSGDFNLVVGGSCTETIVLNGGDTCTVDVAFAPNSVGMLSGSLDIGSDAGAVSADLSGDGLAAAALAIDAASADFGGVLVGASAMASFTLSNTGDITSSLDLSTITVNGAGFTDTEDGTCTTMTTLGGGDTCTVEVQFTPTSVGAASGSLAVQSNAGDVIASLSGDGLAAAELMVTPLGHDFGNVTVGDSSVFTFTLSNSGDQVSSLDLSSIAVTGADFSVTGGTCSTTTPVDGGDACTVVVQFAPQETGAASGSLDVMSDVGNVSASLSGNGLDSVADLSISKQLDSDPVIAGTAVTFTVTVSNAGPSTAVAVVASDVLDTMLLENASASGCNNDPDGLPACQLGDLAPGDDASFTITADLLSSATGTLDNTATVTSSTDDPDAANNAASISAAIDTVSDLVITQVDSVDPVPAGAALSYNVTVVNNGPSDAINVTTGGLLPLQVTDPQVGTCIANPSDPNGCSLGNIAAGEVITYEQDMTVLSDANGATLENEVSVNSDTTDDDAGNNMATEETAVIAVADLAIDKVSGTVFTNPEASIEYTISVSNPGPSDVLDARVIDMPPARLGNLDWECNALDGASCSNAAGMGDIDELVDLPAGSSVEFILMADLQDDLEQPVTNTASVAAPSDASDPSTGNNQASDTDAVGMFADGFEDLDGQ